MTRYTIRTDAASHEIDALTMDDAAEGETVAAEWSEGGYFVSAHDWHSADGDRWTDARGLEVEGGVFDALAIRLCGGPRDGEVVA